MASWMIHLRVAQGIYKQLGLTHVDAFILGNIAPDSGIPKEDGSGYLPDAGVSHFRVVDQNGIKEVHEERFIERFFTDELRESYDEETYAFYFGYLTHLLTDKLWAEEIGYGAKNKFPELFDRDRTAFWNQIKRDWYDMDFMYLRKNPDFEAFRIYENMEQLLNRYVDVFAPDAFEKRRQFITAFYRDGAANVKVRETYLSPEELDRFGISAVE
ncbi:MAG: zinc dependent phospholipase C family protein, partial [Acetatifactor sp.]|nr:zinc dependent phospholipase C family protein [Acetatifactor sp.]